MLRSIEPSQYLAIRYTERLAQEGAVISVGSRGDSYDNALAETINGLYKAEVIYGRGQGPWRTVEDVELATCRWVHWWNHSRLLWPIGGIPPDEYESTWHLRRENQALSGPQTPAADQGGMNGAGNHEPEATLELVAT